MSGGEVEGLCHNMMQNNNRIVSSPLFAILMMQ